MEKLFVPNEILRALKAAFPEIDLSTVEWSWEYYNKIYEASFELDDMEYEVEITVTGHHLLTETEISVEDLPEAVRQAAAEHFEGFTIDGADRVEYSNGDVFYELELEKDDTELEVHIREDGMVAATGDDL